MNLLLYLAFIFIPTTNLADQQTSYCTYGYIATKDGYRDVSIRLLQTQTGYMVERWEISNRSTREQRYNIGVGGQARLIPVNPNNKIASSGNFTHYFSTGYGNVYLNINTIKKCY